MKARNTCLAPLLAAFAGLAIAVQPGLAAQDDLFASGEFFVGCNYWAKNAGMYMWRRWRPDVVEQEVAELAKNGVEVMRVFPLWPDFQPLTGDCTAGGSYRAL